MSERALTIWIDESTDISIDGQEYNLIGYLITNSDKEEFEFLNRLKQSRKKIGCWNTLHGNNIRPSRDQKKLLLINSWLHEFTQAPNVYFHAFLYRKDNIEIQASETYEHYFAKKSIASIANKMKDSGLEMETWFRSVRTITILFDRRRSHKIHIDEGENTQMIAQRLHSLETVYKNEIKQEIRAISERETEITLRFSFLAAECFDGMQFSDVMLYLIRHKLLAQMEVESENEFTKLFDTFFIDTISDEDVREYSLMDIYQYDKKFNFYDELN